MAGILIENGPMKSIKISEFAHKGLQLLAAAEDIKQGEWASLVIIENLYKDHPDVYAALKAWAVRNDSVEELEALTPHDQ